MRAKRTLKDKILPCYQHLFEDNDIQIEFLWGTRDSGKTKAASQLGVYLFTKTPKDFKGILIRKVKDTIKDSIYANVNSVIDEWKLTEYFDTSKSPMEIRSNLNNGTFLCRGLDEPAKLKSLMNPTLAIVEEGDQITSEDLTMILTTLRHNEIKTKLIFLFNPEMPKGILKKEDWWLWKDWFSHTEQKSFTNTKKIEYIEDNEKKVLNIKYRATHTTFNDNPYCPPERKAFYYDLKQTNPVKYLPYAKGEWGQADVKNPAINTFNRNIHVGKVEIRPNLPLYMWVDFNDNPLACTIWQMYWEDGKHKIRGIGEIRINKQEGKHSTQLFIDFVQKNYQNDLHRLYFCGDATGNMSRAEGLSNWIQINSAFKLGRRLQLPSVNPNVLASLDLCNYVFYRHPDIVISETMENLLFEIEHTERNEKGIVKDDRKDASQRSDFLDTMRYGFNYYLMVVDNIQKNPIKFGIV